VPKRNYFCAGSNGNPVRLSRSLAALMLIMSSTQLIATTWDKNDSQRQWMYLTAHSLDWLQTRYIANHSDAYYETNPLLGREPSQGKVDAYFFTTGLLHSWIAYNLRPRYRKWFQYSTLVMETGYVGHNVSLGIGFDF